MQIGSNSTSMQAGLTVAVDKEGRDHCVVVVKGTFAIDPKGNAALAETQEPLVTVDVPRGEPGVSSLVYECDFALFKPRADVIVNGQAVAPKGEPVEEMTVTLEVASSRKEIRVVGDRRWESGMLGFKISPPTKFAAMPLVFERAFGGIDLSHPEAKNKGGELRNPVGIGFHKNGDSKAIEGTPLPNLEDPKQPIRKWSDAPTPVGLGVVGRGWQPRIKYAGTYDERWLNERFPFLPLDFDFQYFQIAPGDQQHPYFKGGEKIRCGGMIKDGVFSFTVPAVDLPITFQFRTDEVKATPNLDTLIIEPDARRVLLTWRTNVPLGRKLNALRLVHIGR